MRLQYQNKNYNHLTRRDSEIKDFVFEGFFDEAVAIDESLRNEFRSQVSEERSTNSEDIDFERIVTLFLVEKDPSIKRLFWLIEESTKYFYIVANAKYDTLVNIADHWVRFASLGGVYLALPKFERDNRRHTSERIVESNRRRIRGQVVSNSMDKTINVEVHFRQKDKLTGKIIRRTKRYLVHDEENLCSVGDEIIAIEGRPLSKRKRHSLLRKL